MIISVYKDDLNHSSSKDDVYQYSVHFGVIEISICLNLGAGDCDRRWAHFIHNFKNWIPSGCQPEQVCFYQPPRNGPNFCRTWGPVN